MSAQELQVVKAFSSISVPEDVIRNSDIKGIVQDILAENEAVDNNSRRLQRLRREKAEGNFFGNLLHGRSDKVDNAQVDLNTSIGKLTQKSSQLLVVNTAISKVLSDQQGILLQQQRLLEKQTEKLKKQNDQILDQQIILERQQHELNRANQGLLEAKGLTQEQAKKLIGCVKRVEESESKLEAANEILRSHIDQKLVNTMSYIESVADKFEEKHEAISNALLQKVAQFVNVTEDKLEQQRSEVATFEAQQKQLLQEQSSHLMNLISNSEKELTAKSNAFHEETSKKSDQLQSDLNQQHVDLEQIVATKHDELSGKVSELTDEFNQLKSQLSEVNTKQKETTGNLDLFKKHTLLGGAIVGLISASSLAWQVLLHFSLIP